MCVSSPFDEIRVAKAILESLKGEAPDLFEMQNVLQHINEYVRVRNFFLFWMMCGVRIPEVGNISKALLWLAYHRVEF